MAIKKLADGPITLTITHAELAEGNYGTQVKFVGMEPGADEDTVLYISERSAVRQLERMGYTIGSCAGATIRMEHIAKDGRTYTNFTAVDGGAPVASAPNPIAASSNGAAPAREVRQPSVDLSARYIECLNQAARAVITMSDETGVQITGSDVVAAAATLFIQANRR
jgi:hypothetical protein